MQLERRRDPLLYPLLFSGFTIRKGISRSRGIFKKPQISGITTLTDDHREYGHQDFRPDTRNLR